MNKPTTPKQPKLWQRFLASSFFFGLVYYGCSEFVWFFVVDAMRLDAGTINSANINAIAFILAIGVFVVIVLLFASRPKQLTEPVLPPLSPEIFAKPDTNVLLKGEYPAEVFHCYGIYAQALEPFPPEHDRALFQNRIRRFLGEDAVSTKNVQEFCQGGELAYFVTISERVLKPGRATERITAYIEDSLRSLGFSCFIHVKYLCVYPKPLYAWMCAASGMFSTAFLLNMMINVPQDVQSLVFLSLLAALAVVGASFWYLYQPPILFTIFREQAERNVRRQIMAREKSESLSGGGAGGA